MTKEKSEIEQIEKKIKLNDKPKEPVNMQQNEANNNINSDDQKSVTQDQANYQAEIFSITSLNQILLFPPEQKKKQLASRKKSDDLEEFFNMQIEEDDVMQIGDA